MPGIPWSPFYSTRANDACSHSCSCLGSWGQTHFLFLVSQALYPLRQKHSPLLRISANWSNLYLDTFFIVTLSTIILQAKEVYLFLNRVEFCRFEMFHSEEAQIIYINITNDSLFYLNEISKKHYNDVAHLKRKSQYRYNSVS